MRLFPSLPYEIEVHILDFGMMKREMFDKVLHEPFFTKNKVLRHFSNKEFRYISLAGTFEDIEDLTSYLVMDSKEAEDYVKELVTESQRLIFLDTNDIIKYCKYDDLKVPVKMMIEFINTKSAISCEDMEPVVELLDADRIVEDILTFKIGKNDFWEYKNIEKFMYEGKMYYICFEWWEDLVYESE
jgi:hypothetical protein